jgi:hypothetical protein
MNTNDYTPTGLKIEGAYENDRNQASYQLYKDIIREVYGVQDVIIGHHLVYETEYTDDKGFAIQVVEEIPSADALIFDHFAAQKVWGNDYKSVLSRLASEPCETRDKLLGEMYYSRKV